MENKILSWYYGNDFWAVKLSLSFLYQTYTSHLIEHVCGFFFRFWKSVQGGQKMGRGRRDGV